MDVGLLVQLTDGGGGYLAAPQGLCDVLHPAHRDAGQVHLYERLLDAALTTAVPLNDGCLKRDSLEARHLERDISRSGGEVPAVVAAAVTLSLLAALVPGCLSQFLRLGFQQLIQGFFHAPPH